MNTVKMYQLFQKTSLSEQEAEQLVDEIASLVNQKFDDRKEHLATKEDVANAKTELTRSIYVASIVQILSILGGLLGILKLMQVL